MKLYIRVGYIGAFIDLYNGSGFLQSVVENETGIRWGYDTDHQEGIERLLKSRGINFVFG